MTDLSTIGSGVGSRGASTRAKLQAELASHRATFFTSVLQQMSRRMASMLPVDVTPWVMVERGISGTRYLERFGGYGRHRELGQIQYQVMMILDYLMLDTGQPQCCQGLHCLAGSNAGADGDGQWQVGGGKPAELAGRCSNVGLHKPTTSGHKQGKELCTTSRSTMDNILPCISEGDGRHRGKAFGVLSSSSSFWRWRRSWRRCSTEDQTKAEGEAERTRQRWSSRPTLGGSLRMRDWEGEGQESNPLLSHMDFHRWAVCLPRWILRTRPSLSSATFPFPIPYPGVWSGSGPGLSSKKFRLVVQRRLLHVLVMALNYVYLGRPATLEEIGRCPNRWHLDCFERLRTFIVACGLNQEESPLAPGPCLSFPAGKVC